MNDPERRGESGSPIWAPARDRHVTTRVYVALLLTFAVLAALWTIRPSFPNNFDELAHLSYALNLAETHRLWPNFEDFPLYDPATGASPGGLATIHDSGGERGVLAFAACFQRTSLSPIRVT